MPRMRRHVTPTHLKPLLSIEEAAEMLGIHRCTLYRSIERGDFPAAVVSDQRSLAGPPKSGRGPHRWERRRRDVRRSVLEQLARRAGRRGGPLR